MSQRIRKICFYFNSVTYIFSIIYIKKNLISNKYMQNACTSTFSSFRLSERTLIPTIRIVHPEPTSSRTHTCQTTVSTLFIPSSINQFILETTALPSLPLLLFIFRKQKRRRHRNRTVATPAFIPTRQLRSQKQSDSSIRHIYLSLPSTHPIYIFFFFFFLCFSTCLQCAYNTDLGLMVFQCSVRAITDL